MTWIEYVPDRVEAIGARLDLRRPNKAALHRVAEEIAEGDGREVVCDLATGVGKTYLAAGLLEYLAAAGVRNVVMIVPLDAIYEKTIQNFTAGTRKHIAGAEWEPLVVTAENFKRAEVAEAMHNPAVLKLYIFKIQTLLKPSEDMRRRVHGEDENIGESLYAHLQSLDDLVVIADEHHVYSVDAEKYSAAIRDLGSRAVVGLTATPNRADADKIIFRYSLAQAIADELVKIPVIVYRADGIRDERSQLADACHLREVKEVAWQSYAKSSGQRPVVPVLFVVCKTVEDAKRVADELSSDLLPGAGQVLLITGGSSDAALRALKAVEEPDSPVRAVVSVDKLKEGWDVRNIGVIIGLRALASETLTEQILGRGLRLPFGKRTNVEAVDTVDIVAHDSYRDLLKNKQALLEQLLADRADEAVQIVPQPASAADGGESTGVASGSGSLGTDAAPGTQDNLTFVFGDDEAGETHDPSLLLKVQEFDDTVEEAEQAAATSVRFIEPLEKAPRIKFPRLEREIVPQKFSLRYVTEEQATALGRKYLTDESVYMTRVALDAQRGVDGGVVVGTRFLEEEKAYLETVPIATVRQQLENRLLGLGLVEATLAEHAAAEDVVRWFLEGAGVSGAGDATWSVKRTALATKALEATIIAAYDLRASSPTWQFHTVTVPELPPTRVMPSPVLSRWSEFIKGAWYNDWNKSVEPVAQFDARSTEWALAAVLEQATQVVWWLRLYVGGPVWIEYEGGRYYPDFIAVDVTGVHWLIEGKADDDAQDPGVVAKREAAESWVAQVNDAGVYGTWRYLFATEAAIKESKGRWLDLVRLTSSV